jgi:hypothetical protein
VKRIVEWTSIVLLLLVLALALWIGPQAYSALYLSRE